MELYDSTWNFRQDEKAERPGNLKRIFSVREEEFGFFVYIPIEEKSCFNVGKTQELPWWGHRNIFRVDAEADIPLEMHPVGFVRDDDDICKADILMEETSAVYETYALIFVSGKIPAAYEKNATEICIRCFYSEGYNREKLVDQKGIHVETCDFVLEKEDNFFFLDLWQHPSSWARTYNVPYWSDAHFEIIENYLAQMAFLGQKVIDVVVSDCPWAGQKCFDVRENASRLYEYNIVSVTREKGKLQFDYRNLDRYISLACACGITEEIDIFGLIGNWHGRDFGSPVEDYRDPIRIRVFDRETETYDFIRTRKELGIYVKSLFAHMEEKGWISICRVIGDEPDRVGAYNTYRRFLCEAAGREIRFKCAVLHSEFLKDYTDSLEGFSLHSLLLGEQCQEGEIPARIKHLTWFACCFPKTFNMFIASPLIESRLTGVYTYIWEMRGFLRWAYGIYVEEPYRDIRYKAEKWAAGDMLLAYPGRFGKPVSSLREKNFLYGIQDFNIFTKIERRGCDVPGVLRRELNLKKLLERDGENLLLDPYPAYETYVSVKENIVKGRF